MVRFWKRLRATVPGSFLAALALAAGFAAFISWEQSHWWHTKQDYSFGWLVPLFVAFVVHDRWQKIRGALHACAAPGSSRAEGSAARLLWLAAGAALAGGSGLFLLGAFYRAGAGPSHPGTLAMTAGVAAIVLPLVFVNAPDSPQPARSGWRDDARVRLAALFVFPALVWLVSAPMISLMEKRLNMLLLRKVVAVVAFTFDALGLPIERQGNVLALPTGSVGVAEACSGIRSLTGCLFAGSFLGAVFLERVWKKLALLAAALALAFLTNLARSLFLTAWAYQNGPAAIQGTVHDAAGYAVLGLTVVGLTCLLPLLNLRLTDDSRAPAASRP